MKNNAVLIVGGILAVVFLLWIVKSNSTSVTSEGELDGFAQCLTDKGATFYGAFWCPHCLAQKALFGRSIKLVNYIECSTPDGKDQLQICKDKEIKSYPTWIFADGSNLTGEVPLKDLADKTSCAMPGYEPSIASSTSII